MNTSIDYSPLAKYSKYFLLLKKLRRLRMILNRVIFFVLLIAVIGAMIWAYVWANQQIDKGPPADGTDGSTTVHYKWSSDGESYDVSWVFFAILLAVFGPGIIILITMGSSWESFAKLNGFKRLLPSEPESRKIMSIPSFGGKLLSGSLGPIVGTTGKYKFALHSRQYKEGGVLRWRERHMDTVLTLLLPTNLPHIVINARGNEKARRSNITKTFPQEEKFQFEGSMGANYDVYAKPESRIVALQLFTPDVLQVLYDRLPMSDIELLGDKLWIVQRYGVLNDTLAKTMIESADDLYAELEKQMRIAGLMTPIETTSVQ